MPDKKSKLGELSDKLHSITNPSGTTGPRDYVQTIVKRIKKKNEK